MKRHMKAIVAFVTPLVLTACPMKGAVWLTDESTAEQPVFGIGEKRFGPQQGLLYAFVVYECKASARDGVWAIKNGRTSAAPREIRYGVLPEGFETLKEAETLRHGCYIAAATPGGAVAFEIDSDGKIRELQNGEASTTGT
jgi:hypothetical protein